MIPPKSHLSQAGGPAEGTNGTQMVSKQTLLCQCCRLALPAPTVLLSCPALPTPTGQQLPTPTQGGLGVTDGMEKNTRNVLFPFRQRRKCHIWPCTAARLGKGQGTGRREAVGWKAEHRPEDVRQMADLAAGWAQSDLQAFSAARAHNTTLCRGCQHSLAGLLGGSHPFKHAASKRQHQSCFMGNSALEKGCLGSGENGREGREIVPGFSSQAYLPCPQGHTARLVLREGLAAPALICPLCQQHRDPRQPPPALHINTADMEQKRMGNETRGTAEDGCKMNLPKFIPLCPSRVWAQQSQH